MDQNRLMNILDSMEDGIYIVNQKYEIEYINHVIRGEFGEVKGRKCYEYFHGRNKVCPWCKNQEVFAGNSVQWEWYSSKNNKYYDLLDTPLKNPDGTVSKLEIFRDISKYKQVENELKRSEERYILAQRAANIGSWEWDIISGDLKWSDNIEPMFGYSRGEFGATYEAFLKCIHPQDMQYVIDSVNACVARDEDYAIEHRIVWPDETVHWVSETGDVIRDEYGKAIRMIGIVQNITERKKAEEAIMMRNRELSSLNTIAAIISQSLELEKVLTDTLQTVLDLMHLKAGWIFLWDEKEDKLTLAGHLGLSREFVLEEAERPMGNCICSQVIQKKKPLITENILKCPRLSGTVVKGEGLKCHASVPLISSNRVVGVMNVASENFRPFSSEDLKLLSAIGHQVGVSVENASLFEDTKQKSSKLEEAYERLKSLYEELKAERERAKNLSNALEEKFGLGNIIGKNHKMQALYDLIENISPTNSTVLIQGESGTGKELIAGAIHNLSPRRDKPFIVANCSAYSENLLESELFGHEKGAFTGAIKRKRGRFELAQGGTIFLDEIGEIPATTQLLLLRVLQARKFERVGGEESFSVDVRVIAASNRDLSREMHEGRFREDLYYRLNVIPILVPPLRERKDDIPLLAKHFLKNYCKIINKNIKGFSEEVFQILLNYHWPGNVRELQNIIEHGVILAKEDMIKEADLPLILKVGSNDSIEKITSLKAVEKNIILKVLKETGENKYQTAKKLGITRSTLYGKLKKYGIKLKGRNEQS
ncbi:MAG: sigma 54-interacting transcriptional regulator [Thermodesulfobacteriota bacterium]|nr:sigma 54-interacting transcriptional regulator [Thermodesulfobacteriota bacterium]